MQKNFIKRGDIFFANLNPVTGSEQGSYRPVLIVQNDVGNQYSHTTVILPITGNLQKTSLPTHIVISKDCGLEKDSICLVEQIRTIDRSRLISYIGRITYKIQAEIDKALAICVGLDRQRPKGKTFELNLCSRCEADFRIAGYLVVKRGWQEEKTTCDFCRDNQGWLFGILN